MCQPRVDQADQRHHEGQEHQHDGGVADHLFAVGPDDLAQFGDDLPQVRSPTRTRTVPRRPAAAFFFWLLGLLAGPLLDAEFLGGRSSSSGSASAVAPRWRDRLPVGRWGRLTTTASGTGQYASPAASALSRSSLTACPSCRVRLGRVPTARCAPSSVHHDSSCLFSYQQGRQDLNLQPAVLETAALPVELRPSLFRAVGSPNCAWDSSPRALPVGQFNPDDGRQRLSWENPRVLSVQRSGRC